MIGRDGASNVYAPPQDAAYDGQMFQPAAASGNVEFIDSFEEEPPLLEGKQDSKFF